MFHGDIDRAELPNRLDGEGSGAESRLDKCARPLKVGDQLVFAVGGRLSAVMVQALGDRRGPPEEARGLYSAIPES